MGTGSTHDAETSPAGAHSEHTPVAVGTTVWSLLFVIGLFIRSDLVATDRDWWIWSAAAGIAIGLLGYVVLRRRARRLHSIASSTGPKVSSPTEPLPDTATG